MSKKEHKKKKQDAETIIWRIIDIVGDIAVLMIVIDWWVTRLFG